MKQNAAPNNWEKSLAVYEVYFNKKSMGSTNILTGMQHPNNKHRKN
jgi:hypothetical protein